MVNDLCKSMNYMQQGENNCELNSNIKQTANQDDFQPKAGWVYYATDYTSKMVNILLLFDNLSDSIIFN